MQCNVLGEEDKIDVLYGSAEPTQARRVRQHLSTCAECREEFAAFEGTRRTLGTWSLPESARPARARFRIAWGLPVAAAVLLTLGSALALRGLEVRYEAGRVSFRIGPSEDLHLRRMLEEQDARHQREVAALRASLATVSTSASVPTRADVLGFIRESEARQSKELLARFEEFKERSDSERRLDMARVSAGLSYLDGKNGQHVARTSELMNYMLQASYKR
jgi:hypothetical protein